MQILQPLPGLEIEASDTIENVKTNIQDKKIIPSGQQILSVHIGIQVNDKQTLSYYNIRNGSVLHIVPPEIRGKKLFLLFMYIH